MTVLTLEDPFERCVWPGCKTGHVNGMFCNEHAPRVPNDVYAALKAAVRLNSLPAWRAAVGRLPRELAETVPKERT